MTLFDQLLANEYSQLGEFGSLFSAAQGSPRTYVGQLVGTSDDRSTDSGARLQRSRPARHAGGDGRCGGAAQPLSQSPAGALCRDHHRRSPGDQCRAACRSRKTRRAVEPAARCQAAIPERHAAPGLGPRRRSRIIWQATRHPPLADRVRLRLGLPEDAATRFLVVEHILLRALPEDSINALPLLEAHRERDPWSLAAELCIPEALRPLEKLIQRVMREETPAHLVAYLVWLDAGAFAGLRCRL